MPTVTEELLQALANGGDAPTGCCMTNTQSLLADAVARVNRLQEEIEGGGGGSLAALTINVGSNTYTYDGSTAVTINIADGEDMEF